jgi:hypothetical protein
MIINSTSTAKYVANFFGDVTMICVETGDVSSFVPLDPANTDYANIMALVDAGELTIAPAEGE